MESTRLTALINDRKKKLETLKKLKIDPYPAKASRSHTISQARKNLGKEVSVVGRIIASRGHGKIVFYDLKDESGKIQLLLKQDTLGEKYHLTKLLDLGDFLQASGKVITTQSGEVTVEVKSFALLAKSIRPLPDKWHGLTDVEERYRKRYVDLIMNPHVYGIMTTRSQIISEIRNFLDKKGFLEVETPTLQSVYGGGFARPFTTHHNTLDSDFYLRISDEMYLKRLIVGGFEKVYEITKVFRNEGVDYDHNPEFTMFEAMIAYEDYKYGMDLIEEIVGNICTNVFRTETFKYQGNKLSFRRPWRRYKLVEAVKDMTGIDPLSWRTIEEAKKTVETLGIADEKLKKIKLMNSIGEITAFIFEELVEKKLIQPAIIYDYPIEVSPLAKKCNDERFTQRFEMFACGSEFGNNYSELNDPIDLFKRFVEEKKREKAGFEEAHQTDHDYLEAIEYGMPPTCGIAIGIDRLVMLLTNAKNIKEVIAFPTLRPKEITHTPTSQAKGRTVNTGSWETDKNKLTSIADIDAELRGQFPGVKFGVAIIENVTITETNPLLELLKKEVLASLEDLTTEKINSLPTIVAYRKFFKAFGIDPGSKRPSPDALLRRIAKKKGLYTINTLVDAYNLAVLETKIGLGAFDLQNVDLPVTLRFAKKGETIQLLGEERLTPINSNEVVYADQKRVVTLDLNYRDSDYTKVTEHTKNIILFADGCEGISEEEVKKGLTRGIELIRHFCEGRVELKGLIH